jgi:allantoinase
VVPENEQDLEALHSAGVFAFKCFLCPSGVDEFPAMPAPELRDVVPILTRLDALLMVHAEWPATLERVGPPTGDRRSHARWMASRPVEAETEAVRFLIELARESGLRVHIVHVSAAETLDLIAAAEQQGIRISAETCAHYLDFAAEEIPDGATEYKCAPPIREARHREALWNGLARGRFDVVVSDHSPAPPELKLRDEGDVFGAWGGIASLQLRLPIMWTLARGRGHPPEQLARWLCEGPARLVRLSQKKGRVAPGCDADLVLWDPDRDFVVEPAMLRHRHPTTPWLGRTLAGVVEATYLRGERIYARMVPDPPARGRLLTRPDS